MQFKRFNVFFETDGGGAGAPSDPPADNPPADNPPADNPPADNPPANKGMPNPFEGNQESQVPEEYTFNLAEGLTMSDELKNNFSEIAKNAKLTQDQVDALIKMHGDVVLDIMNQATQQAEAWAGECQKAGYMSEENIGYAKAALKVFGGDDALRALVDTGAANNPAVLKMLINIGTLISEDKPVAGESPAPVADSADMLFPNSKY